MSTKSGLTPQLRQKRTRYATRYQVDSFLTHFQQAALNPNILPPMAIPRGVPPPMAMPRGVPPPPPAPVFPPLAFQQAMYGGAAYPPVAVHPGMVPQMQMNPIPEARPVRQPREQCHCRQCLRR